MAGGSVRVKPPAEPHDPRCQVSPARFLACFPHPSSRLPPSQAHMYEYFLSRPSSTPLLESQCSDVLVFERMRYYVGSCLVANSLSTFCVLCVRRRVRVWLTPPPLPRLVTLLMLMHVRVSTLPRHRHHLCKPRIVLFLLYHLFTASLYVAFVFLPPCGFRHLSAPFRIPKLPVNCPLKLTTSIRDVNFVNFPRVSQSSPADQ